MASIFRITLKKAAFFLVACTLYACGPETPPPAKQVSAPVVAPVSQPEAVAPEKRLEAEEKKIKVAILLPLSGPEGETGNALLKAATMALFDAYDPRLELLPFDTKANAADASLAAQQAVVEGASIVLGPLLAENVVAAGDVLAPVGIPLIGFSSDSQVAAPGRYILGFMPEEEVRRVVQYAVEQGIERFAGLLPEGVYGNRVRAAFGDTVSDVGAHIMALESYPPDPDSVAQPIKRLANYDARRRALKREVNYLRSLGDDATDEVADELEKSEVLEGVPYEAVLMPEGGALLRTVAPLLPYYEIDPNKVKLMGTGLWNDPSLLREPPLQGAWFAAPPPDGPNQFMVRFNEVYGMEPPRIASLAYDAFGLVAFLVRSMDEEEGLPVFSRERLTNSGGFSGVDGLFRFLEGGTSERALAVLEINSKELKVVDPAPEAFPAFGYVLR